MKRVISNTDPETPAPASPAGPPTESTVVNALPWKLKGRTQVFAADGKTPVAQFYTQADAAECIRRSIDAGAVWCHELRPARIEPSSRWRYELILAICAAAFGFAIGYAVRGGP